MLRCFAALASTRLSVSISPCLSAVHHLGSHAELRSLAPLLRYLHTLHCQYLIQDVDL